MTDAELLTRYVRDHDQHAFTELVRGHARLVLAAARRLAPRDADDVAQATFVLLAQRADRLLDRRSLAGWLYETTRRCASNARRIRQRHDARLRASATPSTRATPPTRTTSLGEIAELLDAALDRLPRAMRDVVLLRHLESLSVAETAERLGVTPTTVTKRSERGLTRLRDFFAARGHATLGVAGMTTLLAGVVDSSTPADVNAIATNATSNAITPSIAAIAKTASPLPMIGAAVATLLIAMVAVAVGVDRPTSRPSVAASTRAAATLPTVLTQDAAIIVACAFIDRLRERDALGLAALLAPDSGVAPADLIRGIRDGEYARYPQRLNGLGGNELFQSEAMIASADGARPSALPGEPRWIGATLESQTPTEANIGRMLMTLRPSDGGWRIASAQFVPTHRRPAEPSESATLPADVLHPPSFGPDETLTIGWLNDRRVRLHGPATMPAWVVASSAFKQWQQQRDAKTFRMRDDVGTTYEIDTSGWRIVEIGGAEMQSVRHYRSDGTLAAVASYDFPKPLAESWGEMDATGEHYLFRATRIDHPSDQAMHVKWMSMAKVDFFAADGSMRTWNIALDGTNHVWRDVRTDPIGENEELLHNIGQLGHITTVEDVPIEGLPLLKE